MSMFTSDVFADSSSVGVRVLRRRTALLLRAARGCSVQLSLGHSPERPAGLGPAPRGRVSSTGLASRQAG